MPIDTITNSRLWKKAGSILTKIFDQLDRGLLNVEKVLVVATGVAIFTMAIIVTSNVILRAGLNSPIPVITVVEVYLLTAAVLLPLGTLQRLDGNVRVRLIRKRIPDKLLWVIESLTIIVSLIIFSYMLRLFIFRTISEWEAGSVTGLSTIQFPLFIHWAIGTIGIAGLCVRLLIQLQRIASGKDDIYAVKGDDVYSQAEDDTDSGEQK